MSVEGTPKQFEMEISVVLEGFVYTMITKLSSSNGYVKTMCRVTLISWWVNKVLLEIS